MDVNTKVIENLKKRNERAFNIVYKKYYRLVYYVAFDILHDASAAEEVMQETFIKLMSNIESYQDNGQFKKYITTIAKNLALNEYKKRKRYETVPLEDSFFKSEDYSTIDVILTLENTLTNEEAKIVSLKVLFDYNFQEIADEIGLTLGVTQARYYKAIEKLRKYFKGEKNL